jgi:hypothetical protein
MLPKGTFNVAKSDVFHVVGRWKDGSDYLVEGACSKHDRQFICKIAGGGVAGWKN